MSPPHSTAPRLTSSARRPRCPSCGDREPRLLEAVSASALALYYRCDECGCLFSLGHERGAEPVAISGCRPREGTPPKKAARRPGRPSQDGLGEDDVVTLEGEAAAALRDAIDAVEAFARHEIDRDAAVRRFDTCLTATDLARAARAALPGTRRPRDPASHG